METSNATIIKNKAKVSKPKHYKVIMYNDDYTSMEFVVDILINIFKKSLEAANKIMMEVHQNGKGIAGIYPYDIAVTKVSIAMARAEEDGFPFKLVVEEV